MVEIDYMVLADAAVSAEGKHYIHGGGWNAITAASFPATHAAMSVAFLLRVPWNDTNAPQNLQLDIVDADGKSILPMPMGGAVTVGRPPTVAPATEQIVPFVFNLVNTVFPKTGTYVLQLTVEGRMGKRFPILLRSTQPTVSGPQASHPLPPSGS